MAPVRLPGWSYEERLDADGRFHYHLDIAAQRLDHAQAVALCDRLRRLRERWRTLGGFGP